MTYQSTKYYPHSAGFSCAFRQWRADSHCSKLHGYALAFKFVFEAEDLDARNWVTDFGGLKELKKQLQTFFDHTTVVASDDPHIEWFRQGHELGVLNLVVLNDVGCEKFAKLAYDLAQVWLSSSGHGHRVKLVSAEVSEHESNSAVYIGKQG